MNTIKLQKLIADLRSELAAERNRREAWEALAESAHTLANKQFRILSIGRGILNARATGAEAALETYMTMLEKEVREV